MSSSNTTTRFTKTKKKAQSRVKRLCAILYIGVINMDYRRFLAASAAVSLMVAACSCGDKHEKTEKNNTSAVQEETSVTEKNVTASTAENTTEKSTETTSAESKKKSEKAIQIKFSLSDGKV